MKSEPSAALRSESLVWTRDGRLRMTAALATILAAHLLMTILVVHFVAQITEAHR